jgi:hypothetical protein
MSKYTGLLAGFSFRHKESSTEHSSSSAISSSSSSSAPATTSQPSTHRESSRKVMESEDRTDFDAEGRLLLAKANLEATIAANRSTPNFWNPCDAIFRHAIGGGIIYVGNQSVAENYRYLKVC